MLTDKEKALCEEAIEKLKKLNGFKLGQAVQFLDDLVNEKITVRRARPKD